MNIANSMEAELNQCREKLQCRSWLEEEAALRRESNQTSEDIAIASAAIAQLRGNLSEIEANKCHQFDLLENVGKLIPLDY